MRNYPQEIEEAALALTRVTSERDAAQGIREAITDGITREVLANVDDATGKPLYSNDKARDLAIRERCRNLPAWVEIDERLRLAELARAASQAKLERLRNDFAVWKLEKRERLTAIEAAIG